MSFAQEIFGKIELCPSVWQFLSESVKVLATVSFLVFVDDSIRKHIHDSRGSFLCRLLLIKGIVSLVTY